MGSRIQRELAFLLTGKDVSASRAMKGVDRSITGLERHAGKAARNVGSNIERGVVLGATAAVGAVGWAAKEAMDFQSSSTSVRKTVEGNADAVIEANRELARSFGFDVNALNAISAAGGAMDIPAEELDDFTKAVAMLSETADDVPTDLGAEALGHLRTNLKLTGPEILELADLVTHLGNNGASTEGQILAMAENVSGAASWINASTGDVIAWSSAMASAGEEAEAGGSAIQRIWIDSAGWVSQGASELKTFAKVSGTSVAQFKKDFGQDASATLAKFITKLGKLEKGEQLAVLEALGWNDIRITRAMGKLLSNTDNLNNALGETENAAGAMGREFEERMKDTAQQIKVLEANVRDAGITVGSELLPVINELAAEGVDWLQGHQPEIKAFAQDLASGIREAVTWARSLDWDAIGVALGAGASAAKLLVEAFANAPGWLQQVLVGAYVGNKLTGGVVVDIGGEILKGALRGTIGITAGVVHVNGPVAGGGPDLLGLIKTGGLAAALATAFAAISVGTIALAITEVLFNVIPQWASQQPGFVPEKNVGVGSEVDIEQLGDRQTNALLPPSLRKPTGPQTGAGGNNVTRDLGLRAERDTSVTRDLGRQVQATQDVASNQEAMSHALSERLDAVKAQAAEQVLATASTAAATAGVQLATYMSAARIVAAIAANRPVVNVSQQVNVSAAEIQKTSTTSELYGPSTGSSGRGSGFTPL